MCDYIENLDENIEILDLINNKINKIPDLSKFKNLKELYCLNCDIKELKNLPITLTVLRCDLNKLKNLDYLPISLKVIECSDNSIKKIDNLPIYLQKLSCYNNPITKISNLSSLSNLEILYASSCKIRKLIIPKSIDKSKLVFGRNPIKLKNVIFL